MISGQTFSAAVFASTILNCSSLFFSLFGDCGILGIHNIDRITTVVLLEIVRDVSEWYDKL